VRGFLLTRNKKPGFFWGYHGDLLVATNKPRFLGLWERFRNRVFVENCCRRSAFLGCLEIKDRGRSLLCQSNIYSLSRKTNAIAFDSIYFQLKNVIKLNKNCLDNSEYVA
jgi:hypothetical protein